MWKVVIVGAGGLGREVAEIYRERNDTTIEGFADDNEHMHGKVVDGISVVGTPEEMLEKDKFARFILAIGDNQERMKMAKRLADMGLIYDNAVHPSAAVLRRSKWLWGQDVVIGAGVVITTGILLGSHVHIDIGCTVSHDAVLGDFVRLNPRVTVCGNVEIEEGAMIGAGAVIRNGVRIGAWSRVGMGSVVTKDVYQRTTVWGNPARVVYGKSAREVK